MCNVSFAPPTNFLPSLWYGQPEGRNRPALLLSSQEEMHRSIIRSRTQHTDSNSLHLQRDFYGSCHHSSGVLAKYAYLGIIIQDNQGDLFVITTKIERQLLIRTTYTVKEFKTYF